MEFNQQAYYKLSNYFISLEIVNEQSPIFFCLCVAKNCQLESTKWTYDSLVFFSKQIKGKSIEDQLKKYPIVCNVENYYHPSNERDLYINIDSQIQQIYSQNQQLGIIVRSQYNLTTSYTLSLQQKRNFCRKCLNIVSCDSSNCSCECQEGFFGKFCDQKALVLKLGLGSDDMIQSAYQLKQKVFSTTLSLTNSQSNTQLRSLQSQEEQNTSTTSSESNEDSEQKTVNDKISTSQTIYQSQYIKLEYSPFLDNSPNVTYSNFYISLQKNTNDKFQLFFADQFQINSSYISQNDFVQEIDFTDADTNIYIEVLAYNREKSRKSVLELVTNDPIGKSSVIKTMKTYRVMLQYDPQLSQNYQFLIVNQCDNSNKSCTNQIQMQYSLSDFMISPEKQVKSNLTYMIAFLAITVVGLSSFCCYSAYKKIQKKKTVQELNEKNLVNVKNTESQFKNIRQNIDVIQNIQDEEMHKMRDQTMLNDGEVKSISHLQQLNNNNNSISQNPSSNKILEVKNQLNPNKLSPNQQPPRLFQPNLIKLQKQESEGKNIPEQPVRQQSRFSTFQENKQKMKQLYSTNNNLNEQEKRVDRINQLLEQQQQKQAFSAQAQNKNDKNQQQPNSPNRYKKEAKLDQTTQNTCNNLGGTISNNLQEISSNNTTTIYNPNKDSQSNIVYLNKLNHQKDAQEDSTSINQRRASKTSIPSEDSHELPQINSNNARPVSHYEIKQIQQTRQIVKQRPSENYLGNQTLNYITTNSSNTTHQVFSNVDFENQSPNQGQRIPFAAASRPELMKYLSNQDISSQNPTLVLINNPSRTLNINESSSEEEESSQLRYNKNKNPNHKNNNNNLIDQHIKENEQLKQDLNSQQDYNNLSQNIDVVCEGNPSELKAIDGSKIKNHRRNVLNMGIKQESSNQDFNNISKENDLLFICQQEISNIMLKKKNEMDSANNSFNNEQVDNLNKAIRFDQLIYDEKDSNDEQIKKQELFKIETPEIFFQNCPKCQSKQHEFQLKLSNFGEQAVKPKDKYCPLCLMKAEMSEVKMADSF